MRELTLSGIREFPSHIGLAKHNVMKTCEGVDVYIHVFLALALVAGEWSASQLVSFTCTRKNPLYPLIGGWLGPRAALDDMQK
jgi:hypothetical protein